MKITETSSNSYPVGSIKSMHPGWYIGSKKKVREIALNDILNEK